jgi:hypothetical protein
MTSTRIKTLHPFEAFDLVNPRVYIYGGEVATGKTNLMMFSTYVGLSRGRWKRVFLMSATSDMNEQYKFMRNHRVDILPVSNKSLMWLQQSQKKRAVSGKKRSALLLIDDCIGSIDFTHNKYLDNLATCSRHYGLTIIICTQNLNAISTKIRENSEYVFATVLHRYNVETLYEFCRTSFETKREFIKFYNEVISKPYRVLRINLACGYNLQGSVAVSTPPRCPDFVIR